MAQIKGKTKDETVRVRLFGAVELSNRRGRTEENRSRRALPWLLLKYLLVNRGREVEMEELSQQLWPGRTGTDAENNARVRLSRLRDALSPLGLAGQEGLVLYSGGRFSLNPEYPLELDSTRFSALVREERAVPEDDPAGLALCAAALELYRGPFLEYTDPAPWFSDYRAQYRKEFRELAGRTLARVRAAGDEDVLDLLCRRAARAAPRDEALQDSIIGYLMDQRRQIELVRHISQLTIAQGAARDG